MDARLRQLQRLAATGDGDAQRAYDALRNRLYPQCSCKQERLLTLGCKCGYGPERPIFDLETVIRGLDVGFRVYLRRDDDGFQAHNKQWALIADPYAHTLKAVRAELADDYYYYRMNDFYDEEDVVEVSIDYPYTWEEWDPFWEDLCQRQQPTPPTRLR